MPGGAYPGGAQVAHETPESVAEAFQGSHMECSVIMDSMPGNTRAMGGNSCMDSVQTAPAAAPVSGAGAHNLANIRTNDMFQSVDTQDAEDLLHQYGSDASASLMSTVGQESKTSTWGLPKKKKGRTTFLNRLFAHRKSAAES